ncbi:MAG TPA: AI-2E family transporter [Sutterella sp.]|nr:AI-2E family transporter [Sutterella sp.]
MHSASMSMFRDRVDILLRLGFGALIMIGCFLVIRPFLTAIVLSAILCVVTWPLYLHAIDSCHGNKTIAAGLLVTVLIITVLIPLTLLAVFIGREVPEVVELVKSWVSQGMPLPGWIVALPYVGDFISDSYHVGVDPEALGKVLQKAIDPLSKSVLSISVGVGNALFQVALVAFISFFFYRDGTSLARRVSMFLNRISGGLSKEFSSILVNTTRSVVFGIIGTAIGQGLVAAVGFIIADVPHVLLLSFAVCMLSVVPVGPPLVWGPVALWLWSTGHVGMAVFIVIWGLAAVSSVDNFLKPVLIARGTTLPLALVFLGVFGGIISFGFLGLVLGPILLAAAIAMFSDWTKNPRLLRRSAGAPPGEIDGEMPVHAESAEEDRAAP